VQPQRSQVPAEVREGNGLPVVKNGAFSVVQNLDYTPLVSDRLEWPYLNFSNPRHSARDEQPAPCCRRPIQFCFVGRPWSADLRELQHAESRFLLPGQLKSWPSVVAEAY